MESYSAPPQDTITSRLESLLRRALDPASPEPEALSSAAFFVRQARKASFGFADLPKIIPALPPPKPAKPERPLAWDFVMPWGKHKGLTLGDLVLCAPKYLAWMSRELSDETIRDFVQEVLDYVAGGGR